MKRYRLQKVIEELKLKTGGGTELVSLYIPPDRQISDVTSHLKEEYGEASNIKSKSTRKNVQAALSSILSHLKQLETGENGIAIFCGVIQVDDDTEMETKIVEPPETIESYRYHCNSSFLLEPLEEMLEEKREYGLIVLDKREATIGMLRGTRVETMKYITSAVPGKHSKGGWSQRRFERLREIATREFYKRIGDHANDAFRGHELAGILIGGPSPTRQEFIKGKYLQYDLQRSILADIDVAYTNEFGLGELVDKSLSKLKDLDLAHEKDLMRRFLGALIEDKAAYGEENVRSYLESGAIDTLLLSSGLDMDKALELAETAEQVGTQVEFVSPDFEEGDQLLRTFGGIASILRFKL